MTCSAATPRSEVPLRSSVGFSRCRAAPPQIAARARGALPRALSSSTRAEVDAVDVAQDSSGVAAALPSSAPAAEEATLPPVDWRLVGGEATSAAGRVRARRRLSRQPNHSAPGFLFWQVITAQANYMRILVRWQDLTHAQRELRRTQLQVSCADAVGADALC